MKKWLWIPAVLIAFFVVDRVLASLLQNWVENSQFRYSRLYKGTAESDILLIGNSRGLMFFQPIVEELTGKKTFNISYNGMPSDLATVLTEDYLEKYPKPSLVLVDITLCDRHNPELIASFHPYRKYSFRLEQLIKKTKPNAYYAGHLSKLFRFNNEIFQRAMVYANKPDTDWLMDRVINQNLKERVGEEQEVVYQTPEDLFQKLKGLVAVLEAHQIPFKLLVNPYYPPYIQRMKSYSGWLKEMSNRLGYEILDYSEAIQQADFFGDYLHLNKQGAAVYMKKLLEDGVLEF